MNVPTILKPLYLAAAVAAAASLAIGALESSSAIALGLLALSVGLFLAAAILQSLPVGRRADKGAPSDRVAATTLSGPDKEREDARR